MHVPDRDQLKTEAAYLHQVMLGAPACSDVQELYATAHRYYCVTDDGFRLDLEKIIRLRLDAEAIEMALRRRNPFLTRKMRILLYIVEMRPENHSRFVNDRDCVTKACSLLVMGCIRAVYKRLKGELLVLRYHVG